MVGKGSLFLLSIVSVAVLSRYLDKAEYGIYRQIAYIYSTLLVVFSAGLPKVFAYFLPRYEITEGKGIVRKINRFLFFLGFLFSITIFLFSGAIASFLRSPELSVALKVFAPVPFFLLPTLGLEGILSSYRKTQYIAIYSGISRSILLASIIIPVITFEATYIYAVYGWVFGSFISFLLAMFFKNLPFKDVKTKQCNLSYKDVFSYSVPIMIASIAGTAIRSADQFFISRYFGQEVFAEYVNGFIQLPFVAMVTGSASVVLMPLFSRLINQGNKQELLRVWKSTLVKSATLIYPLVIFFIVFAPYMIVLLYSEKYESSVVYFQIAQVVNFFNIITFAPLILALGKSKAYANIHIIFALLTWIGEFILILLFDSPIPIAVFSVSKNILIVLTVLAYCSKLLELRFVTIFPLKKFIIILFHCGIVAISLKLLLHYLLADSYELFLLSILSYILIIFLTAPLFKIDYMLAIRPMINKMFKGIKT